VVGHYEKCLSQLTSDWWIQSFFNIGIGTLLFNALPFFQGIRIVHAFAIVPRKAAVIVGFG
jgi:hypothetical protein